MEKNKKMREIGLREYQKWRQGPWRGYYIIGRFLTHRYGLLDVDFRNLKNEGQNYNQQRRRYALKKEKQKGGIKTDEKDETNKESFEEESS